MQPQLCFLSLHTHMQTTLWRGIKTHIHDKTSVFITHSLFLSPFKLTVFFWVLTLSLLILHFHLNLNVFLFHSSLLATLCWHWGPIREKIEWQRCMLMTWKHWSIPHWGEIEREGKREKRVRVVEGRKRGPVEMLTNSWRHLGRQEDEHAPREWQRERDKERKRQPFLEFC